MIKQQSEESGQPSPAPGATAEKPIDPKVEVLQQVTATNVENQVNTPSVNNQHNYFGQKPPDETPLEQLVKAVPRQLPRGLHPFRDPRHEQLLRDLKDNRILLLTSFGEQASFAVAHELMCEPQFEPLLKKMLDPTSTRDKDRKDLEVETLAQDAFLTEDQILLVEIGSRCLLIETLLARGWGIVGTVCERLKDRRSFMILTVDENLVKSDERARDLFSYYTISHLRYLLTPYYTDPAEIEQIEQRLLGPERTTEELEIVYSRIRNLIENTSGADEFRKALQTLLTAPAARGDANRPKLDEIFRDELPVHRTTAFVATYFNNLPQRDFDRVVALLVGTETRGVEHTRQVISRYGIVGTVREEKREPWLETWQRDADMLFHDCQLQTIATADGSWVVDFSEPSLRHALRAYIERRYPWYLRNQCRVLQKSGLLFAFDLSQAAVDGLVHLFVERAVAEPADFGVRWLLDLITMSRAILAGKETTDQSALEFLKEFLKPALRRHFQSRLAPLIREMLDHEVLHPVIQDFFEELITGSQRAVHVHIAIDLIARLRAAPHFDAMKWMRRVLNNGQGAAKDDALDRLVSLARDSGPRIYEFLSVIREWMPDEDKAPDRFSQSERVALDFPFHFCVDVARRIGPENYGQWPSRHPLFYALPDDLQNARQTIGELMDWILDPRGAALETETTEALRTPEAVRISAVADLVEHWAWVLEGDSSSAPEGQALFAIIIEELGRRIGGRERSWFQRIWQRRQDELLNQAGSAGKSDRRLLIGRKTKLDQLRARFAALGIAATTANATFK